MLYKINGWKVVWFWCGARVCGITQHRLKIEKPKCIGLLHWTPLPPTKISIPCLNQITHQICQLSIIPDYILLSTTVCNKFKKKQNIYFVHLLSLKSVIFFISQTLVVGKEEFRIHTLVTLVTNVISLAFLLPSIVIVALFR